jgi:hypothetical protein
MNTVVIIDYPDPSGRRNNLQSESNNSDIYRKYPTIMPPFLSNKLMHSESVETGNIISTWA